MKDGGKKVGPLQIARLPFAGGKNIWVQIDINNEGKLFFLTVAAHNILFDMGKAIIKTESASAIAPIGELLKNDATLKLEIQGRTDNSGTPAANLALSKNRAAAVKAYLVANFGIPADRLTTSGFGDTKPTGDNRTDAGRVSSSRPPAIQLSPRRAY